MPRRKLTTFALFLGLCPVTAAQQIIAVPATVAPAAKKDAAPDPKGKDDDALKSAGLKADDPALLLGYLRQRTLSDADLVKIRAVINRMGEEVFEERVKAAAEAEAFGPAAIAPLRTAAQNDPDPEIAYRAGETLKRMEKVSHTAVALAVVRAVAKLKPTDATKALLGYLPLADTMQVEDEIRAALIGMALRDGKPDAALVAALTDANPIRRAAAAVALIDGGPGTSPVHIPEAFEQVKAAAKAEKDPDAKFRILYALLTTARDDASVPDLIGLIPELPRGRIWQAEDYLVQLAGKTPPKAKLGSTKEALGKGRDEWLKWWDGAKAGTKLTGFTYAPKTTGRLLVVTNNTNGWGNGKLAELGPDLRERWKLVGLNAPLDYHVKADGKVTVMESSYSRMFEKDPATGETTNTRNLQGNQPMSFQVFPDGTTLVAFRNLVALYDKDWKQTQSWVRNNHDVSYAQRLSNGQILVVVSQPFSIVKLDDKWKELPDKIQLGDGRGGGYYQARFQELPNDRILITEQNRVVEYEIKGKEKKEVWKVTASNPSSAQRLPNGNTLIVDSSQQQLREVSPEGDTVWSYAPTDGTRVMRAERK